MSSIQFVESFSFGFGKNVLFLNNREHKANVLFFTRAHFHGLEQVCFPFGNKSSKGEIVL
jgi:hypothetical protein